MPLTTHIVLRTTCCPCSVIAHHCSGPITLAAGKRKYSSEITDTHESATRWVVVSHARAGFSPAFVIFIAFGEEKIRRVRGLVGARCSIVYSLQERCCGGSLAHRWRRH